MIKRIFLIVLLLGPLSYGLIVPTVNAGSHRVVKREYWSESWTAFKRTFDDPDTTNKILYLDHDEESAPFYHLVLVAHGLVFQFYLYKSDTVSNDDFENNYQAAALEI